MWISRDVRVCVCVFSFLSYMRGKKNMSPVFVCDLVLTNVRETAGGARNTFEVGPLPTLTSSPLVCLTLFGECVSRFVAVALHGQSSVLPASPDGGAAA